MKDEQIVVDTVVSVIGPDETGTQLTCWNYTPENKMQRVIIDFGEDDSHAIAKKLAALGVNVTVSHTTCTTYRSD